MSVQDLKPCTSTIRRARTKSIERVVETITTTNATPTTWAAAEYVPDTTAAGCCTVRYTIQGLQSDGSKLYSIVSEVSYAWAAGGPIIRQASAGGTGTASANTFQGPRPSHTFDINNVRPVVTGRGGTTIIWSGVYKVVTYT